MASTWPWSSCSHLESLLCVGTVVAHSPLGLWQGPWHLLCALGGERVVPGPICQGRQVGLTQYTPAVGLHCPACRPLSAHEAPASCQLAAWPPPEAGRCLLLTCLSPSSFLRRQAPLEGLEWRMAHQKPGGLRPCSPLPAGTLWCECGPGCGQCSGPQGELGATLGPTQQTTLPLPVGAQ